MSPHSTLSQMLMEKNLKKTSNIENIDIYLCFPNIAQHKLQWRCPQHICDCLWDKFWHQINTSTVPPIIFTGPSHSRLFFFLFAKIESHLKGIRFDTRVHPIHRWFTFFPCIYMIWEHECCTVYERKAIPNVFGIKFRIKNSVGWYVYLPQDYDILNREF